MTDFRALCAELHAAFNTYAVDESHHDLLVRVDAALAALAEAYEAEANNPPERHPDPEPFQAILRERAAALAQPEPQGPGPTDEELSEFATDWWNGFAYAEQGADVATPVIDIIHPWHFVGFLRDGLARWGRPVVEPVPNQEAQP